MPIRGIYKILLFLYFHLFSEQYQQAHQTTAWGVWERYAAFRLPWDTPHLHHTLPPITHLQTVTFHIPNEENSLYEKSLSNFYRQAVLILWRFKGLREALCVFCYNSDMNHFSETRQTHTTWCNDACCQPSARNTVCLYMNTHEIYMSVTESCFLQKNAPKLY